MHRPSFHARIGAIVLGFDIDKAGAYEVDFGKVFKVFDTFMSVLDASKQEPTESPKSGDRPTPAPTFADQVEMRLTNVVISALKEAFNRDEARLELERAHLEEQRRRAEETMRIELRRQAAEREISRLRLLGLVGMIGWIASILLLALRRDVSHVTQGLLIAAAILSLCSLGSAFIAQGRINTYVIENNHPLDTVLTPVSLSLLLAALGAAAVSLLL
jgi:hypothetical protein